LANIEKARRRAQRRRVGTNILLHDGYDRSMGANRSDTLKATEQLLQRFAREGVQVVGIDVWS
jgi:hypothetical protein